MTNRLLRSETLAIVFATGLAIAAMTSDEAYPHQAHNVANQPMGWTYDLGCCSTTDCRAVPANTVKETRLGYVVPSGELIRHGDKKIRRSKDQDFHWCTVAGKDDGKTLCLYIPPSLY